MMETISTDTIKQRSEITIVSIETKRQQRDFVDFPLELYRDNPYYVPPFRSEEMKIFRADYMYYETCESVFFGAYRDGKMVGRIQGILQKTSNELRNEKRVRFTRFDSIDDLEVAQALFVRIEQWALSLGMDTVCGPLGFSDFEHEGLLVEGFDQIATFGSNYNADYYPKLIEACGFTKEVDWLAHKVFVPEKERYDVDKMVDYLLRQSGLHLDGARTMSELTKKYTEKFFDLLDVSYAGLYQTVPFTPKMRKNLADSICMIGNKRYTGILLDENERTVALGVALPSIVKILQKSKGRITPSLVVRLLKETKHPTGLEFAFIGVLPEYRNTGAGAIIFLLLMKRMREDGIAFAETNLNLEYNTQILAQWKSFDTIQHKRYRAYIKPLA